jgi:FG-GAP repeat
MPPIKLLLTVSAYHCQMRDTANRRKTGFSLIMVSILLTVAALIFVSVLPGGLDVNQRTINNTKRLEKIEEGMRSFMAAHQRRPCPADGQYDVNTANFGLEAANPGNCTTGTPAAPMGPDTNTTACTGNVGCIVSGVIPTKTLGLPDDYAFDEYGRRFEYAVDTRATSKSFCNVLQDYPTNDGKGGLVIKDGTTGNIIDNVMYAYISHGKSGYGAYPEQGGAGGHTPAQSVALRINTGSTDTDKQTNAGVDGSFNYSNSNFTNVKVRKDPSKTFDDLVWYREDLKNTCCIGPQCPIIGFRLDGYATTAGINDSGPGTSMAVGDINGDGYADIVTATNRYGSVSGTQGTGEAWVYFGTKASNIVSPFIMNNNCDGTNCVRIDGIYYDGGGLAVSAVGDINHDGYDDIVFSYAGGVYVVFGEPASFWALHPVYTLDATPGTGLIDGVHGFEIDDTIAGESFGSTYWGYAVTLADINGDSYKDIIIGAYAATVGGATDTGKVYVIYGGAGGLPAPTVNTHTSTCVDGVSSVSGLSPGQVVTGTGFASGTTITALNTCLSGVNTVTLSNATSTSTTTTMNIISTPVSAFMDGTHGFELDGVVSQTGYPYEGLGAMVAAGDINGDHYDDMVLSTFWASSQGNTDGDIYTIFGSATPPAVPTTTITASSAGSTSITVGSHAGLYVGQTISSAGLPPLATMITLTSNSAVTTVASASGLYAGQTINLPGTFIYALSSLTGITTITAISGNTVTLANTSNYFTGTIPMYVVPVITGCGTTTLGAACTSNNLTISVPASAAATGASFVDAAIPITNLTDATNGFELYGGADGATNRPGAITVADVDGDGNADIILSGGYYPWTSVVYGQAKGAGTGTPWPYAHQGLTAAFYDGTNNSGFMINGISGGVIAVGDVNHDGHADIIVGNNQATPGGNYRAGSVDILFGPSSRWPASTTFNSAYVDGVRAVEFDGPTANGFIGASLAVGDFNKDGYPDILIGAPGNPLASGSVGSVWGIWGKKAKSWANAPITDLSTVP